MTLIIGGGIGGLSAAHYLLKNARQNVIVAEASKAVGGWIQTVKDTHNDLIFEKGPRTIRIKGNIGAETLLLIEELGLESKIKPITLDQPSIKNRLIYVNDELHFLPSNFSSIFKKIQPFTKPLVFAILKDIFTPKKECLDENIYDFVERRFGRELADYLISPMICGICAGNSKEISVKFLMPYLFESEQKHGSVSKGFFRDILSKQKIKPREEKPPSRIIERAKKERWSVFGFKDGMRSFPDALYENIVKNGAKVFLNSNVTKLSLRKNSVKYKIGDYSDECDHVISSLPARFMAPLLKEEHPWLAEQLGSIPYVTVGVVNLAYERVNLKYNAFGFLIPPSQNVPILGVVFDSCNLPQGEWTILTVMMGGYWYDKYFGKTSTSEDLFDVAVRCVDNILGIKESPDSYHVQLMENCIPQYVVGHHKKVDKIFEYIDEKDLPLSLIGSSYKGIGLNDVILSAKVAVEQLIAK